MLHKVPAVPVGVQTAVHSHSRQHEGTFRPFSRLLRQAGHTVGQFCTPKGDPGTTGGGNRHHSCVLGVNFPVPFFSALYEEYNIVER